MENSEVAEIFSEMADLMEIKGENPFRIRSFRRAALTIENLSEHVTTLLEKHELEKVPGIGEGIARRIKEIIESGDCADHRQLRREIPEGLLQMMRIEGMGPKTAKLVYEKLGIETLEELEQAAAGGKLQVLEGMGEKKEEKILKGIKRLKEEATGRVKLSKALPYAETIVKRLRGLKEVEQIEIAGSLRRRKETIGDIDILVASSKPKPVMDTFTSMPEVQEVLAKGETKSSVRLKAGIQVDVRVLEKESFGAALAYFTGSKEHNIAIRDRGKRKGLKISEYGVFREKDEKRIGGEKEEEVFKAVGLPWIPPEIRENRGEIEAAEADQLPKLIELKDLKGDLQMHTKDSDGQNTIREMAEAAMKLGYQYIAITDHSKAVGVAGGMDAQRLEDQIKRIDKLNRELDALRILKGIEVDILPDGRLDMDLDLLRELDIVLASIHSKMNMTEEEMTDRILKALDTGVVHVLAHPTGRLLGDRKPYAVNLEKVFQFAKKRGILMELNSYPDRLDLTDIYLKQCKDLGIRISIGTDSHSKVQLENIRYGIFIARRGWLEPKDVINTYELEDLLRVLRRKK